MTMTETPFSDYWSSTIFPAIKLDYERLLQQTPSRIAERHEKLKAEKKDKDKAKEAATAPTAPQKKKKVQDERDPVLEKIASWLEDVKAKGERRSAYGNLAWTGPIDNTDLSAKLSLGKVENMAADMFLKSQPNEEAAETAADSQEAADDAEAHPLSKPQRRAVETLSAMARRPWQIPDRVEKGFEIPIMVTSPFKELEIGKFKRLGLDVAVNAVWLA